MTEVGIAYDHNPNPPRHGSGSAMIRVQKCLIGTPWRDRHWPKKPAPCIGKDCPKTPAEPAEPAESVEKTGKNAGPDGPRNRETGTQ